MMLHTKYQGSRPNGSDKKMFSCFSIFKPMKSMCPLGGAIFASRGIICKNLVEVHKMTIYTKLQGSRPCGFNQEVFFMFSLYKPM